MLLKRIIALPGESVAFRNGALYVDGKRYPEPYVKTSCNWELEPRTVKPGYVYVVGDNRGVDISEHVFGQTPITRVVGSPFFSGKK